MSTHRRIGIVCVVCIALALAFGVVAYALRAAQDESGGHEMGYENRIFDTAVVHTIDIVMSDWDSFIEGCEDEEYAPCAVVVDGESFKNVAIRAKGNTSLSNVSQLDSDRYSFKIEFDQYETGTTYHGLDKLSLNNIIQDNTYLKDYLAYRLMNEFGVDAPLASFAYITVNGEDWGLYLAVEGVEDSFLERVYGSDVGELYKPDSTGFGGGRGNGREFDMQNILAEQDAASEAANESDTTIGDAGAAMDKDAAAGSAAGSDGADAGNGQGDKPGGGGPGGGHGGGPGGGMGSADVKLQYIDDDPDSYANIFDNAKTDITAADKARLIESLRKLSACEDLEDVLDMEEVQRYFVVHDFVCNGDSYTGNMIHNYYLRENDGQLSMIPWDYNLAFGGFDGGDATSLVNSPIDDPVSSGSGGMHHNSQEEQGGRTDDGDAPQPPNGGQMPGFPANGQVEQGGTASSSPSTESDSRPMVDWIFTDESYTARYHELYQEFIDTVDIQSIIAEAEALITPYVERDPTKFCTYEEFQTGADTLKQFCALRVQSVRGQLDGTIPSTEEGQQEDSSTLVDASAITISDMGSMGQNGGGPGGFDPNGETNGGEHSETGASEDDNGDEPTAEGPTDDGFGEGGPPSAAGFGDEQAGDGASGFQRPDDPQARPSMPFGTAEVRSSTSLLDHLPMLAACMVVIVAGIAVTFLFRRP